MALSGTLKTSSYDGRYYQLSWTATQSVADNKSTVSWTLDAAGGESSWYAERTLTLTIAGSTVYTKTDRVERYAGTVASGTVTISHGSTGTASFAASIQAAVYYPTVNCTGSTTFTLDTIPRKSTLTVSDGTLGTAQTLTVTMASTSFTHTISCKCGDVLESIVTKSTNTSISFTPPLSFASDNTSGTSVTVVYTIYTYDGTTLIGYIEYTKTCAIPTSVKPSCSLSVTDADGYADVYGKPIQSLSRLKVAVTPTLAYGSSIAWYIVNVGENSYSESTFTTEQLKTFGEVTVSAMVCDNRSRTGTAETLIDVYEYSAPLVSNLVVRRCNADGTVNIKGAYVIVSCDMQVTSLDTQNSASYLLKYKKSSDANYTTVALSDYAGQYSVSGCSYIFEADTGSSYDIVVEAIDKFQSGQARTSVSTAFTIMHWLASGLGMAIGKIAELENVFDIGFKTKFSGGILQPVIEAGTNFNSLTDSNTYTIVAGVEYTNCPITTDGTLTVENVGEEGLRQIVKDASVEYVRIFNESWSDWFCSGGLVTISETSTLRAYKIGNQVIVDCYDATVTDFRNLWINVLAATYPPTKTGKRMVYVKYDSSTYLGLVICGNTSCSVSVMTTYGTMPNASVVSSDYTISGSITYITT